MVTDQLDDLVRSALRRAWEDAGRDPDDVATTPLEFERPKRREHGDWSTNVALRLGAEAGGPRSLAQAIASLVAPAELIESVEVAGPGFLNFRLSSMWLRDVVKRAATPGSGYGHADSQSGTRVNVEYVSANPTGPLNVVSGRHAAVGDAVANLLAAVGHDVTREFYINDAGRQADLFGASLAARYLEHLGRDARVPEKGYHGEYVKDMAAAVVSEHDDEFVELSEDDRNQRLKEIGIARMVSSMRASLERFGSRFDVWFSERELHDSGKVRSVLDRLTSQGLVEEREGALWFRSSELGDDKDRVIVKANGEPTYLAADLAYVSEKFGRGFDLVIYLWGADHHGAIVRFKAGAEALGFGTERIEVLLVQIVALLQGGEAMKASKRAGVIVPLDELIDEVGADAARYTFLTRSIDAPLEFDIDLVKEQAPENPVYYVQYAHARICSILRRAREQGIETGIEEAPLDRLAHDSEDALMRKIASYEEVVPDAAAKRAPQRIVRYVEELASDFSAFYRDCKVVSADPGLTQARLALCVATRSVIADALGLLSVAAPERM